MCSPPDNTLNALSRQAGKSSAINKNHGVGLTAGTTLVLQDTPERIVYFIYCIQDGRSPQNIIFSFSVRRAWQII